jgi:dihydrofolate reductase
MESIVAIDCKNGIGKNGVMPWNIKEDLLFFKKTTINNIVIMGKNTFFSLSTPPKPLPNRLNIVLTSNPSKYSQEFQKNNNIIFTNNEDIYIDILNSREKYSASFDFLKKDFKIFIIGGETLYAKYAPLCDSLWVTHIHDDYNCDKHFNFDFINNFESFIINSNERFTIKNYVRTNLFEPSLSFYSSQNGGSYISED